MSAALPRLAASPSIYEFLAAEADEVGRLPDHVTLPDEAPATPDRIRWAPGALDGVIGARSAVAAGADAQRLAELIVGAANRPSRWRLRRLLDGCPDRILETVDATIERVVALRPARDGVRRVGHWLAATGTERDAVKLGIAMLGIAGVGDTVGLLRTLGAHDEFTLFVVTAFGNGVDAGGDAEIWSLAEVVDGWGRIQCVERLCDASDPAIQRWILRTGFRNSIGNEYTAYTAATTGRLLDALRGDVDRELLDAAGDVIEALTEHGPARNIYSWDGGAEAIGAYLSALTSRAETPRDYLGAAAVRDLLTDEDGRHELSSHGWTDTHRTAFEGVCAEILARPMWPAVATTALGSPDEVTSRRGDRVLRDLCTSTFEHHLAEIRTDPRKANWFDAWQQADGVGAQRLVQLARDVLPLERLGSGAGLELFDMGPQWADHSALEWTLQALDDHPGVGGDLLMLGLKSPVIRSRNVSLRALERWPAGVWPDGARTLVAAVADNDPDESVRATAQRLL